MPTKLISTGVEFPDGTTQTSAAVSGLEDGVFSKATKRQVAWKKTGNDTAESATDLVVEVNGTVVEIPSGTSIQMPSGGLVAGTDYGIFATEQGTLEVYEAFSGGGFVVTTDTGEAISFGGVGVDPQKTLFEDTTINYLGSTRPLGDTNGDGTVTGFDGFFASQYAAGTLTDQAAIDFIENGMLPFVNENPAAYAPYFGGRPERFVGGFHYAPGGNASFSLDAGDGGTTPQINEYSFYDLRWRPSVADPRGLTLVGDGAFWAGIYLMSANHLTGAVHKYNVDPCRDGNPPRLPDDSGNYPNAEPSNIFESLAYHGFRAPDYNEFQLLAYGVNEARSIGGSGPGSTGDVSDRGKDQQTSHWGVFDATGVLRVWGRDHILATSDQSLPDPSRGDRFRFERFADLGGDWGSGSDSGSRGVVSGDADTSYTNVGGRGVCSHLILD